MFNIFRFFTSRNIPHKINFGRFDIETTEKQKMTKAILANSDNCGDIICGEPKLVKNIIKYGDRHSNKASFFPHQYSTLTINTDNNNPELCCQFYNFNKCENCHMNK